MDRKKTADTFYWMYIYDAESHDEAINAIADLIECGGDLALIQQKFALEEDAEKPAAHQEDGGSWENYQAQKKMALEQIDGLRRGLGLDL